MKRETKYNKWNYMQFPLYLLPELLRDYEITIKKIIMYGVYQHALGFVELDLVEAIDEVNTKLNIDYSPQLIIEQVTEIDLDDRYQDFLPMVKIEKLIEFKNKEFKQKQVLIWIAYIAIHSIVGKHPYYHTYALTIAARMCGYVSRHDVPEELTKEQIFISTKLNTPDKMKRLFKHLDKWGVYKTCPPRWGIGGYYVTLRGRFPHEKLIEIAIKRSPVHKKITKENNDKKRTKDISNRLRDEL